MENNIETLSAFIARVMHNKKLTSYDVQIKSGNSINQSYVVKLKNGDVTNVSAGKLKALALGLGVMEEEIFAIARGKNPNERKKLNEQFENISLKFDQLPPEKKPKAESLVKFLDKYLDDLKDE